MFHCLYNPSVSPDTAFAMATSQKSLWPSSSLLSVPMILKNRLLVKKLHTYIALLEVCGHLIRGTLYITSPAGLRHPTLVWRFQEATNIPVQGGTWPVCPLMPWHYWYSFTPEWGEALSIWSKGVLNPSYLSLTLVSLEPATSHTWAKNYTIVPLRLLVERIVSLTYFRT